MQMDGTTALVTGGGSGIGRAMCRRFAEEGARLVVVDRDGDAAAAVAAEVDGVALTVDVSTADANAAMISDAEDAAGPIDLLVLNAGIGTGGGVLDAPDDAWQRAWDVNVMAHVWAARAWLPGAIERGGGTLLHTASAAGLLTNIGAAPYSVSKHAVVALAEWLAITHGDQGVKVHALCPMFVETPLVEALRENPGGKGLTSTGVIQPEDVAAAVVAGLADGSFLILPHPEVAGMEQIRATERDRWLGGMRKLQRRVLAADES